MPAAREQATPRVTTARVIDRTVAPLLAEPEAAGVFLDVDGTLAPIAPHPDDARVPEPVQRKVAALARRYPEVACVSGRTAVEARRLVGIGAITYVGNHGMELLRPGGSPQPLPGLEPHAEAARDFAASLEPRRLRPHRIRVEDKGAVQAFHWRGSPDPDAARACVEGIATEADAAGLVPHWGRLVMEVRPPVEADKGKAVAQLVEEASLRHALYAGDDLTDVYAFRSLHELQAGGRLETAVRVGVVSEEGPAEIGREADVVVAGPEGVDRLLDALLA